MLSLLIPTYNYNVQPLVLELQKQAEALGIAYEIIVFDDASNEKQNIISDFNQFIHFENNDTNLGRTQTRLKLALKAKFDNLLFLDADVLPEQNNFLATYLPFFASTYSVVCGGCSYEDRSNNATQILRWKYGKEREEKKASEEENEYEEDYAYDYEEDENPNSNLLNYLSLLSHLPKNNDVNELMAKIKKLDNPEILLEILKLEPNSKIAVLTSIDSKIFCWIFIHFSIKVRANFLSRSVRAVCTQHTAA